MGGLVRPLSLPCRWLATGCVFSCSSVGKKKKKPTLLHPGMAQLSRGNPKFNFLSGGKQDRHINESSTLHFYDQCEQPNSLLITLGHLPVLFVLNAKEKLLCLQLWRSLTPAEKGRGA